MHRNITRATKDHASDQPPSTPSFRGGVGESGEGSPSGRGFGGGSVRGGSSGAGSRRFGSFGGGSFAGAGFGSLSGTSGRYTQTTVLACLAVDKTVPTGCGRGGGGSRRSPSPRARSPLPCRPGTGRSS